MSTTEWVGASVEDTSLIVWPQNREWMVFPQPTSNMCATEEIYRKVSRHLFEAGFDVCHPGSLSWYVSKGLVQCLVLILKCKFLCPWVCRSYAQSVCISKDRSLGSGLCFKARQKLRYGQWTGWLWQGHLALIVHVHIVYPGFQIVCAWLLWLFIPQRSVLFCKVQWQCAKRVGCGNTQEEFFGWWTSNGSANCKHAPFTKHWRCDP